MSSTSGIPKLRVAKPVTDLARTEAQWTGAWGLDVLWRFEANDHSPFDGIMLGVKNAPYHFEFTVCRSHEVKPTPTPEDLVVFYYPDKPEFETMCAQALAAGWKRVRALNPYWEDKGCTFADADGYLVTLANMAWSV